MRSLLLIAPRWLVITWLVLSPRLGIANAIKGRVVDSAGQPVVGAEVRIWQKLIDANGVVANEQVKFADGDVLLTDDYGRFDSPDVLVGEAFARIVAEADGMLAGRSGWIEISGDAAVAVPDIILKRLRAVIGKVIDRQGRPITGATVFNSGDGHKRVDTATDAAGEFTLNDVPEGSIFLFAERRDYRFTGIVSIQDDKYNWPIHCSHGRRNLRRAGGGSGAHVCAQRALKLTTDGTDT